MSGSVPHSFSLLRQPFVRAVFMSQLFSQCGIWVRNFAVLLYVMDITSGDAWAVSMISVAEYAPIFVFSFLGGVFADRWPPKRTTIWCEWLSAGSVFIVFLMLASGSWEAVFAAVACSSILSQFAQPSGMKLFKIHVNDAEAPLCMSLLQLLSSVFMIIGPIMGTWVYHQAGIELALFLTGTAFGLSALAMLRIPPDPLPADKAARSGSVLREIADGIRYVVSVPILRWLSLCFMLVGLGVGLISPLSIFLVTERLGLTAQHLQWITIPYGAGEIIGGIIAFRLAARISPKRFLMIGLLVNGAGIVVSGLSAELWLTMAAQCLIALWQPAIFIGNHTLVMQHTDQAYIGRVTGIRTPLMTGAMLLAMSFAGILKDVFSLVVIYELAALCFVAGFLVTLPAFTTNKSAPAAPAGS
ncbi:MFS transporter [Paenibacillus dendritiformis]|uniref:Major facilitator transporter n=1 Tax=Paenibacillus dendritiformis C454 TaxID=1131935 RepID=H3SJS9_9BACL|nr:MFS transporter [Paenibacillus dendritiformis]EHQ60651.1 major facilitator transporter [Paenibacillus dendritiformis C454]CAH8771065.1 MFS transporter [Paenibacillus dendritiformis]